MTRARGRLRGRSAGLALCRGNAKSLAEYGGLAFRICPIETTCEHRAHVHSWLLRVLSRFSNPQACAIIIDVSSALSLALRLGLHRGNLTHNDLPTPKDLFHPLLLVVGSIGCKNVNSILRS
jgi:hypothetical protein